MTFHRWSTVDKDATVALSGTNNLTATSSAGSVGVLGQSPHYRGKWYWEYSPSTVTDNFTGCGVAFANYFDKNGRTTSPVGYIYYGNSGLYGPTGNVSFPGSSTGQKVCIALDLDNMRLWIRLNGGNWNSSGTADPATNVGGMDISAYGYAGVWPVNIFGGSGSVITTNFGDSAFAFTVPSGFSGLDDNSAEVTLDRPSLAAASGGTAGPFTLTFSTQQNDEIVVVESWDANNETMTISDSAGLTWNVRQAPLAMTVNGNTRYYRCWWAHAATPLTADVVTFTKSGGFSQVSWSIAAFRNVDLATPFDPNANASKTTTGTASNVSVTGLSSNCTEGLLLGFTDEPNAQINAPSPSGTNSSIAGGSSNTCNFQRSTHPFKGGALSSYTFTATTPSQDWLAVNQVLALASAGASGTWGSTEADDTFAASGGNIGGTMGPTDAKDAFAAAGGNLGGTMGPTEARDAWVTPPFGTWGSTEAHDALASVGYPDLKGVWGSTEAADAYHMAGGAIPDLTLDSFADAIAVTPTGGPAPSQVQVTLSTNFMDDVIVLMIASGGFWDYHPVSGVTDTAGLTWHRRASRPASYGATGAKNVEIWWAHAPTPLSGDVITVTTTGATGQLAVNAIAIAGANYAAPWDAHPYANQWNFRGLSGVSIETGFASTHAAKTMTLLMSAGCVAQSAGNTAFPFTFLGTVNGEEHNGGNALNVGSAYNINGTALDQSLVEFGPTGNSNFYSDSIVQAGQTGTASEVLYWLDGYLWQIGTGAQIWPSNVSIFSGANGTVQCSLSTSAVNEVLVAVVSLFNAGGAGTVSSIADSAGLASGWTRRSRKTSADGKMALEVWYAFAPTTVGGMAITAHTTGTVAGDYAQILAFGVVGATYFYDGVLWDGDTSLPDEATYTSATLPIGQVVTGMSTINVNTLDLAFMTNFESANPFTPAPGGAATYPDALGPYSNTTSPNNSIGVLFKFSASQLAADLMSSSVASKKWVTIGDAIAVGPPQPPTGVWGSHEGVDIWTATGFVPAFGTMNPTEPPDVPGGAPNVPPFAGVGWIGWVPAFATFDSTDSQDRAVAEGWVIGAPLTGVMGPTESKDRAGLSNRTTVTGTMGLTELSDRYASSGFELPKALPAPPRKRRLLIVS